MSYWEQIVTIIDDFVKKYVFYPIDESDDEEEEEEADVLSDIATTYLIKKSL